MSRIHLKARTHRVGQEDFGPKFRRAGGDAGGVAKAAAGQGEIAEGRGMIDQPRRSDGECG
jgi:hypothetical protein